MANLCEIKMKTIFLTKLSLILLFQLGCQSQNSPTAENRIKLDLSTPAGLVEYLAQVPAVKNVEIKNVDGSEGIVISTMHYQIHTTLLDPLILRPLAGFMESAYKEYQKQLPQPIETKRKFVIYLFKNRMQWEEFTKKFVGPNAPMYLKIKKGAYYLNGVCVAYNIGSKRTFPILGHEGWHQFNSRLFAFRLPSWLDEGIATLFEATRDKNGSFTFAPDKNLSRLGALRQTILSGNMIPLRDLIALNPGYVVADSDAVIAFYAQSYALVRFLREEGYGKRLSNYHNLLLAGLRGKWPIEPQLRTIAADRNIPLTAELNAFVSLKLFSLYIGEDLASIEKEYRAFCRKIIYHVRLKK